MKEDADPESQFPYLRVHLIRMSREWYERDKQERGFPDFTPGDRVIPIPNGPLPESDRLPQPYTYEKEPADFAMVMMVSTSYAGITRELSSCGKKDDDFFETIEMRKLFHKMESQDVQEMMMMDDLNDPIQNFLMQHYNGARDFDRSDPRLVEETYTFADAFTVIYKPKIEVAKVYYQEMRTNHLGVEIEVYRGFYISTRCTLNMYPPAQVDLLDPERHLRLKVV